MKLPGYRLGVELVHTAESVVYRATRESDERAVIIKVVAREYPSPSELRRLSFEHRILDKLRGPGVIETFGLERCHNRLALVLEDFGAKSLAAFELPLSVADFLAVAKRAVTALGRVHALNVIHKNIRPHHLLATADLQTLKLIDFQLASEMSSEQEDVSVAHELEGSLPYISPEQTGRMNRCLDYRSDYYSLGVAFFELLTGELPYSASDVVGWVHCHISKVPREAHRQNPDVPVMLSRVVSKLMAKEPHQRYQSARGLLADLERCERAHAQGRDAEELALGAHDVSQRFALSQQIVGREAEARALVTALDAASRGAGKLLLVSGYSGVGKSSLIREIHKPLTLKHGYFISGKFDQLDRSLPYAALADAFRSLFRQLLTEPEAQIQKWRERILTALGAGASVMAELIAPLTHIIGPQPPPPPLEPAAAQNRFKLAFARLITCLASPQHPLVIFLDDLQWADASTPELIADLFSKHDVRHLLIVCAFRDNEVHAGDPLDTALHQIEERAPDAVVRLRLEPLAEPAIALLVAGALKCTSEECQPLAHEIYEKTEGNPFFARELLLTLYRAGALTFEPERGHWRYDLDPARQLTASDNVIDLLLRRIESLPRGSLSALQAAACIGNVFSLDTLSSLLALSLDEAAASLWQALAEGLVMPLDESYRLLGATESQPLASGSLPVSYRFAHDRVQQAAYASLGEGDRSATHLRIGRRLRDAAANGEPGSDLFSATNHLNLGSHLMTDVAEREALARQNQLAGAKAFAATAFAVAARYHDAGVACLSPAEWAERPRLHFDLLSDRIGSVLMAAQRERAALLCDELFAFAPENADRGSVYLRQCQVLIYQGKLLEAIACARKGLAVLGVHLPEDPAAIARHIDAGIEKMQAHLARVPIEELPGLPELEDAEKVVAMQLLFQVVPPAIMVCPPLFILAELQMFDLSLRHGTTAVSAKNFVDCGMIQGAVLGDYAAAYRLGKVAFQVLERYGARALGSQVHFVFAAYVSMWGAPYTEALEAFRQAQRLGVETGDHQHLAFAQALYLRMLLHLGRHLDECDAEARAAEALFARIDARIQVDAIRLCRRAVERLRDPAEDAPRVLARDQSLTEDIVSSGNTQWAFQHGQAQMLVNVVLGDFSAAERWSSFTKPHLMAASTLFTLPEYHLCECLITTQARWPEAPASERPQLLAELKQAEDKLRGWAEGAPDNFAHKRFIVAAEIARIEARPIEVVMGLFEQAIATTGDAFLHLRALATELYGRYWLELCSPRLAEPLLLDALLLYTQWGATAKVRRLERQCQGWFGRTRPERRAGPREPLAHTALDLGSVLKASRAISGEVRTERLFATLMSAILENAAAERGCLILPGEPSSDLLVRARLDVRSSHGQVSVSHPLEEEPHVCTQMVRYAARSLETLVIDDASTHQSFDSDVYVRAHAIKSVLCMPISSQGRLVAVLYVENNATTQAFTRERVETLRLIAGQAAISLTNASLYESLEHKVAERTRELAARTRQSTAMLDSIEQGVFTIDRELRVQPEHSRHLEQLCGSSDLTGRTLDEVLWRGADLAPATLAASESALRFSFGATLLVAKANADYLIKDFTQLGPDGARRHLEVDWSFILGEDHKVEKVLVTARDVTRLRGLEQAAVVSAREAQLLSQILDAGVEDFKSFLLSSRRLLDEHIRAAAHGLGREQARALFRDVHTLKGHSSTLGLHYMAETAHAAEEACAPEHQQPGAPNPHVLEALQALDAQLEEYARTGERKLGRSWTNADARFKLAIGAIESALSQRSDRPSYPVRALSQVKQAVHRVNAVPLDQVLRETARVFPSLARELGKSVPELEWVDDGTLLDPEWGRLVKDAFVHSFRNSLDHGIESLEERHAAGKAPHGKIALRAERDDSGVHLHLSDDGRGLALDQLREAIGGVGSPDQDVAEAIFEYGISTARQVSRVSGRGIGMDAVRAFFREHGGDVVIEFTGPVRSGYRPFELVFRLPTDAAVG